MCLQFEEYILLKNKERRNKGENSFKQRNREKYLSPRWEKEEAETVWLIQGNSWMTYT